MEHVIESSVDGVIATVICRAGQKVSEGDPLIEIGRVPGRAMRVPSSLGSCPPARSTSNLARILSQAAGHLKPSAVTLDLRLRR